MLVVSSGAVYRIAAYRMSLVVNTKIELPVSLNAIANEIGDWVGQDVPIPDNIQRIAGNDDFLSRVYTHQTTKDQVNVYIAYSAHPRTMLGHKPEKCYVGSGWTHESTENSTVITRSGKTISCLIHRFGKYIPENQKVVVLNYYLLNGQITSDERNFSGIGLRTPNIAGDPARYVAQVQISSVLENSVRLAAEDMTDLILDYFPDPEGIVHAAH